MRSGVKMNNRNKSAYIETAGGKIKCRQCQAMSKRTEKQCRSPAMRNKTVCRIHGGMSTGPKTPEGKARCSAPHTTYGHETRKMRKERAIKVAELKCISVIFKGA
ncbi:HGGxSTG domain-containing protein [Alteromonas facilis]|uniref:HGGxSTG domain-containing protein n=1 Tax=Alteromonas facilis TaxID=2048004 RepID=UPI000C28DDDB